MKRYAGEWVLQIEDPTTRLAARKYLLNRRSEDLCASLPEALLIVMHEKTEEGVDFWKEVYDYYLAKEQAPKMPVHPQNDKYASTAVFVEALIGLNIPGTAKSKLLYLFLKSHGKSTTIDNLVFVLEKQISIREFYQRLTNAS